VTLKPIPPAPSLLIILGARLILINWQAGFDCSDTGRVAGVFFFLLLRKKKGWGRVGGQEKVNVQ
jgi:hypothetical protein